MPYVGGAAMTAAPPSRLDSGCLVPLSVSEMFEWRALRRVAEGNLARCLSGATYLKSGQQIPTWVPPYLEAAIERGLVLLAPADQSTGMRRLALSPSGLGRLGSLAARRADTEEDMPRTPAPADGTAPGGEGISPSARACAREDGGDPAASRPASAAGSAPLWVFSARDARQHALPSRSRRTAYCGLGVEVRAVEISQGPPLARPRICGTCLALVPIEYRADG